MITFKKKWRTYKNGVTESFNSSLERRLVTLGIATYSTSSRSILETDLLHRQDLYNSGFTTIEKALSGDLTIVKGIGKVTEKAIKNELHNSK